MKKKSGIIIFVFFFIFSNSFLNAQDTSIIKYLPLQVGNKWVYNWTTQVPPTTGKVKLEITSTINTNGHNYYVLQQTGSTCACASLSPFLISLSPIRVDSNSGNILLSGGSCSWLNNEGVLDSLNKRIGDSARYPCNITNCYDTSTVNVLGILSKTKFFSDNIMTNYSNRKYAKYIGLYYSSKGCPFNITCTYSLQGGVINNVVYGDTSFPLGITQISTEIPENFSLSQNYPNPFNPTTLIKFEILNSKFEIVSLIVYDILGREIQTLVNEQLSPGTYEVEFDGTNYPSGVYYYSLSTQSFKETKRMVLLR